MIPLYLYYRIKRDKEENSVKRDEEEDSMAEMEEAEQDEVAEPKRTPFSRFRAIAGAIGRTAASATSLLADPELRGSVQQATCVRCRLCEPTQVQICIALQTSWGVSRQTSRSKLLKPEGGRTARDRVYHKNIQQRIGLCTVWAQTCSVSSR